jgi:hypothetical protein
MESKPKNPDYKYWSKAFKGLLKQIQRQQNKPTISKVIVCPIILSYSSKHSEYRPLKRKIYNNTFRGGKGLDDLHDNPYFLFRRQVNGMYTRCLINRTTGKYYLSKTGKEYLNKLRTKNSRKL